VSPHFGNHLRPEENGSFNAAHIRTRNGVERCFGVLKHRFYSLQNRIRFQNLEQASKLVQCACIIHNLCVAENDDGSDLPEVDIPGLPENQVAQDPPVNLAHAGRRRNQLLQHFV